MAESTAVLFYEAEEPDAATRGHTTIADKVIERLSARAALDVPGVLRHSPGPDALSVFTHRLPRASVESAGDHLTVSLELALDWSANARDVADAVREQVRERIGTNTGKTVDRVNVKVSTLLTAGQQPSPDERRVR